MKKIVYAAFCAFAVAVTAQAAQTTKDISPLPYGERSIMSERAIAERIAPSARVCIAGEKCEKPVAKAVTVASGPRSGEDVYNKSCMGCHSGALPTAPAKGDAAAWNARKSAKGGLEGLVKSAVAGTAGGMPPKGTCMDCSDDELKAAIEFMMK